VILSDGSSKALQKKPVLQKNRAEKFLTKKATKNPKPHFLDFCLSRLWAFLGEGRPKTRQKNLEKN
jgi:hypothetical protein